MTGVVRNLRVQPTPAFWCSPPVLGLIGKDSKGSIPAVRRVSVLPTRLWRSGAPKSTFALYLARLRVSATWVATHVPPRAAGMRHAFRASAIFRKLAPSARIGAMIGRMFAAN